MNPTIARVRVIRIPLSSTLRGIVPRSPGEGKPTLHRQQDVGSTVYQSSYFFLRNEAGTAGIAAKGVNPRWKDYSETYLEGVSTKVDLYVHDITSLELAICAIRDRHLSRLQFQRKITYWSGPVALDICLPIELCFPQATVI